MSESIVQSDIIDFTPSLLLKRFFDQYPELDLREYYEHAPLAKQDTQCVCCSRVVLAGQPCHDNKFLGNSFGDAHALRSFAQDRGVFCPECKMAMHYFPSTMQFSYVSLGFDPSNSGRLKAYKVFGLEDFLAAIYKPLSSPMVLVKKERKKQHMIWKAKVNLHDVAKEDFLIFSSGERSMVCHPKRVLALAQKEQSLIELIEQHVKGKKKIRALKEIFPLRNFKSQIVAGNLYAVDYRYEAYGIDSQELIERLDNFVAAVNESCTGDRFLFAHLKLLAVLKKNKDYPALIHSLEPKEVDMQSIILGKSKSAESENA